MAVGVEVEDSWIPANIRINPTSSSSNETRVVVFKVEDPPGRCRVIHQPDIIDASNPLRLGYKMKYEASRTLQNLAMHFIKTGHDDEGSHHNCLRV